MFSLPRIPREAVATVVEGASDENPINLSGVTVLEFETLLRYFYGYVNISRTVSPFRHYQPNMADACTGTGDSFFSDAGPQHARPSLPTAVKLDRTSVHRAPLRIPDRARASDPRDLSSSKGMEQDEIGWGLMTLKMSLPGPRNHQTT